MIKPTIVIDWDDTTAPFNSIACEMATKELGIEPALKLEDITSWENTGRASVIHQYYHDERLYMEQSRRISEDNIKCIRELMKIAEVYFATAVYPDFMGIRVKQVTEAFPELGTDRIILGAAKHLVNVDVILDDNICNVLNSPAKHAVLMRKPWNRQMTGLLSVNSLEEFALLIYQIYAAERIPSVNFPSVVALVGPSGSGKNDVMNTLTEQYPEKFERPTSYTTNPYNAKWKFRMSEDEFRNTNFLESTRYAGYGYGTKEDDVKSILENGKCAVMPLDICGAIGMKKKFPTVIVYINKNKADLIADIIERKVLNTEKTLRLLSLDAEKKNAEICDFVFKNDDTVKTAEKINKLFI